MSESVRFFLESRIPELEDLFKKGLFSKEEIKEIVSKRTKFEHKIKRRGAIFDDFLAYIHYETELEQVRKQRYEMLNVRSKHSVSDHSLVKYILSLYRRAVTKFRGNMPLWDQYITFALESKSDKAMPKILASALQLHPESVEIWIKSANWELNHLNNPASARALFMRGIRMNKESKHLWFEYFRMELEVASKLCKTQLELSEKGDLNSNKNETTVYDGAIAIAVFKFAVKNVFIDSKDAFKYFDLSLKYENMNAVSEYIESFVSENMSKQYLFFTSKAKSQADSIDFDEESSVSNFEKCMVNLNQALNFLPLTSSLLSEVINTMQFIFEKSSCHGNIKSMIFEKLGRIYESGELSNLLTIQQYIDWCLMSLRMHGMQSALNIIQNGLKRFPDQPRLLEVATSLEFSQDSPIFTNIVSSFEKIITVSPDNCILPLDSLFKKYESVKNPELLKLALLSVNSLIPSSRCIKYALSCISETEFFKSFDHSKITPEFNSALISTLLEMNVFSDDVRQYVCKISVFSTKAFSHQNSALSLLKFALLVGDVELSTRIFSRSLIYLPTSEHESFTNSFEKLKDSDEINLF